MKKIIVLMVFLFVLSACQPTADGRLEIDSSSSTEQSSQIPLSTVAGECGLDPVEIPLMPAVIPGYAELDEATGLHMTGRVQQIDLATYRLKVTGLVDRPREFTYDQLRCMPKVSATARLICPGLFEDESTWSGVPLSHIFELTGLQPDAKQMVLISADGYKAYVPIEDALAEDNMIAYEMLGKPLPVLHGFPVRAVLPTTDGGKWIKWLIEVHIQ